MNNAGQLANSLIKAHNLIDWSFEFDNAVRRFGCCHYNTKTITLSKPLTKLNPASEVKDVILHEIAHALCKRTDYHNHAWQAMAKSIGCNPTRCYSNNVIKPKPKYITTCKTCGKQGIANRNNKSACGACCRKYNNGKYSNKYKLTYTKNK